ncbi:MAG: histidinol-phosphate transaminase [Pseudomonadota bacterium]
MIDPRPHLASLEPYGLGIVPTAEDDRPALISLAQNESARHPSPRAIAAGSAALSSSSLYADSNWTGLRDALASVHDLDPASILCGSGSMELISLLMRAFAGPGASVLSTAYAYAFFRTAAEASGAEYVAVPERDMTVSVDAVLGGVTDRTKIVCVANPGNPSGTRLPSAEIRRLRDGLSDRILLVIDEAYGEFADDLDDHLFDLAERGDTVVLRTLSKAYGLAGLRVGWGVFPASIAVELRKVQAPGPVSNVSLAAAEAAILDQAYMLETVAETRRLKAVFLEHLTGDGVRIHPSFTNFVLIEFRISVSFRRR